MYPVVVQNKTKQANCLKMALKKKINCAPALCGPEALP